MRAFNGKIMSSYWFTASLFITEKQGPLVHLFNKHVWSAYFVPSNDAWADLKNIEELEAIYVNVMF